jgi:hypothetical protein
MGKLEPHAVLLLKSSFIFQSFTSFKCPLLLRFLPFAIQPIEINMFLTKHQGTKVQQVFSIRASSTIPVQEEITGNLTLILEVVVCNASLSMLLYTHKKIN